MENLSILEEHLETSHTSNVTVSFDHSMSGLRLDDRHIMSTMKSSKQNLGRKKLRRVHSEISIVAMNGKI